jgi:hypothetical protein
MVTRDKEKNQSDESGTKAHTCCDETDHIDCSNVRHAGPAQQAKETDERERAANEEDTQEPGFVAHETASLVAAV